jgi:hypothetical protein
MIYYELIREVKVKFHVFLTKVLKGETAYLTVTLPPVKELPAHAGYSQW